MEDTQIVALYWQRDEAAIRETEKQYSRYLTQIAYQFLGSREDSQECVNDAYLNAWNSIPPHRPEALSTYLGKLVRQRAIDLLRKRGSEKRGGGAYLRSLSELEECADPGQDPARTVELQILADAISTYLYTLPLEARNVFVCRYFFGDSIREIAAYCGAGVSKIKSMLHRTRLGLKQYLKTEGFL